MERQSISPGQLKQCSFVTILKPLPRGIWRRDIYVMDKSAKAAFFQSPKASTDPQTSAASEVLERLETMSPSVAGSLEHKSDAVEQMKMRLFNQRKDSSVVESSYITLSYCWHSADQVREKMETGREERPYYPLPISPALFQALLAERRSETEGIWCDQICIDQDNESEKTVTISAIDVLYRSARAVVVALDDIEINSEEQQFLRNYSRSERSLGSPQRELFDPDEGLPPMESNSLFRGLFEKIVGARWFTRAWCAYEMRLASNHIFLIRCTAGDDGITRTVLRFDGSFLSHFLALAISVKSFKPRTYDILPALIGTFGASDSVESDAYEQTEAELKAIEQRLSRISSKQDKEKLTAQSLHLRHELMEVQGLRRSLNKTYLRVFLEVFELDAGGNPKLPKTLREQDANKDKLSIVLNTIASGLILKRHGLVQGGNSLATKDECCRKVLVLALCMNDPLVLCTTGQPLRLNGSQNASSWLSWPEMTDIEDNLPPIPLSGICVESSRMTEYVKLDLLFLGQIGNLHRASKAYLQFSRSIIVQYAHLNMDHGPQLAFWNYVSGANTLLEEREAEILACMLDCGASWILRASEACRYTGHQALQEYSVPFCDTIYRNHDRNHESDSLNWLNTSTGNVAATAILDFAYFVALMGIPFTVDDERWKPFLFETSDNEQLLYFSLVTEMKEVAVEAAVPAVLLKDEYKRLPRVWILRQRRKSNYELLGKSRMFGGASIAGKWNEKWQCQKKPRIYGPQHMTENAGINAQGR